MAKTDQEILMQNGYDPAKFKLTRLPDGSGKVDPIDSGFSFSGAARDPVSDRQLSQSTAAAMDPRMTPSGLSAQQSHSQYSTERAFGTGVAHGALPAAAGFAGGLLAEAGLSAAGVAGWPLAAGVGVAGLGASVLAGMGQQALRTPEEQLKLDEMIAQHPRAYQFGNLAPNLVFGLPGIAGLQGTARFAGNTAALGMRNATRLAAETGDAAHVVNTALGAGMVAGTRGPEIVRNYAEGKPVDWEGAAIDAAAAFGLNRNNPWTGKAVNRIAGREIMPETMQPFNKQKSEALREGPGKQSFPSREEQLKVQEEQAFATRFQKAQQEAHELAAEEARRAREAQLTALEQANEAKRKALEQTPEQAALQEELDKANAGLTTPKPKVTTAEALGKATPDAPVPDAPQTVDAQVAAALDPKSTRKVVLFTDGQDAPDAIEGLLPVVLTNGKTAFFNPRKWKSAAQARKAVLAADKEQFDATLLGMSQSVKPANAAAVVTTDAPNGTPNVQAEVVGPEGAQAAAAAGQAAVPGGTTKVKPAGAVEGERLSSETPESFNTEAGAVPQGQQATYRLASALGASGVDTRVVGSPVPLHDPSNPDTSYHGKFRPGAKVETPDGVVEVPPAVTATTQRADTLAHEATHVAWDRFDAKQRAKFEAGLKDDPEYLAAVASEPDLTPQEFVARHGGVELLKRIAAKDWGFWKDVGATWRVFRGQGDKADVLRQLGNMLAASPDRKGGGVTYRALTDEEVASGMRKPEPVGPAPTYVPNFQAKFGEPADTKVRSEEEANLPRKPVALLSERVAELRAEFPNHEDTVWTEAKARWRLNGLKQTEPKLRQYIDQLRGEGLSDLEVNQQLQHDALGGYADQPQYSRGTMDTPSTEEPYSFGGTKYSKGVGFGTIDRISDPEVEFAFRRAFNDRDYYLGPWARHFVEKLTPDERAIIDDVRAKRVQWYRKTGAPAFTPEEKALSDKLDAHYTGIANEINAQGGPRVIKPRPYYEPENISTVAKHWLTTKGSSVESHAIEKAIADHWVDPKIVASKGLLEAQQEAATQARSYVDGLRGSEPDQDLSTHFGPLRKEAGFGLPASVTVNGEVIPIREADAVRALTTYGRRTARDFAFYKNVEEPYGVGLNGQQTPIPNVPNIKEDPFVVHAMTAYRGRDVGGENPFNQRVHQAMRMASSMKLAAVAGVRNVLQLPTEMFKYAGNDVSVPLQAFNEARSNYNDVLERAIARGGFRRSQSDLAYADNTYSTDRVAELFGQAADAIGKWGGRGKLEEASRVLSTAQAEIRAAKMLADNDVEGMRRLGVDPTAPHAGEKLTLALTSAIEGTYDARELPTYIWSGNKTFEDLFSVFKWNIEKSNTFYKDVLKPAANGNPGPLIMSLAAAAGITVPLTKFLNEFVNKRKAGPTWREISTADEMTGESHLRQRAAWLTDAVNLAGVAGMYSTLANQAAQLLAGNAAHNLVFVAGNEVFLKDLVNAGVSYIEALNAGEDPIDAAGVLTKQMLSNMFQTGRALMNQLPAMKDELQRKSDLRDRSVYEQLVNDKQGQRNPATPNPAIGMKEKEFKQTADMVQATELLDILVKRYVDKYKTRPDLLKDKLESLARNPDRLFPSLDGNDDLGAVRYASYLRSVFGDEELKRRASEAAMRQALNSAKSDMARQFVPDL